MISHLGRIGRLHLSHLRSSNYRFSTYNVVQLGLLQSLCVVGGQVHYKVESTKDQIVPEKVAPLQDHLRMVKQYWDILGPQTRVLPFHRIVVSWSSDNCRVAVRHPDQVDDKLPMTIRVRRLPSPGV